MKDVLMPLTKKPKKPRVWEVDFFRGAAILLVLFDHTMLDIGYVFNWQRSGSSVLEAMRRFSLSYLLGSARFTWRHAVIFVFFIVAGVSSSFSRNNLFRGIKLALVALCVSLVTYLAELAMNEELYIQFGVLHCLAVVILFYGLLRLGVEAVFNLIEKKKTDKLPPKFNLWKKYFFPSLCVLLSLVFTVIHLTCNYSLVAFEIMRYKMPTLQSPLAGMFFFSADWLTTDYFPVFPYIAPFFFGAGLAGFIYQNKKSLLPFLDGGWNKPVCFCGRRSLIIYLGGQVVAVVLLSILSIALIGRI